MGEVTIVTDASTDLSEERARRAGVIVAPMGYELSGRHLRSGDQTPGQLYDALDSGVANVSGVAAEDFESAFKAAAERTKSVLCVCQSIGSSFTRVSAEVAARDAAADTGASVRIINPGKGGPALAAIVLAAARLLADRGLEEAFELLERLSTAADALLIPTELDQLERAGQLTILNSQSAHGPLSDGVPVLRVRGNLSVFRVEDSREAAEQALLDRAADVAGGAPATVVVTHALAPKAAERLLSAAKERLNVVDSVVTELGPALGCLLGRGAYGLGVCVDRPA